MWWPHIRRFIRIFTLKYPKRLFYFVRLSLHLRKGSSSFGRNSSHHCRHLWMVPTWMFPFWVQIQQYLPTHDVDGCTHWVKCYSSFVNLTDFIRTEIWASQFSPLGILINLNKGRMFNAWWWAERHLCDIVSHSDCNLSFYFLVLFRRLISYEFHSNPTTALIVGKTQYRNGIFNIFESTNVISIVKANRDINWPTNPGLVYDLVTPD